MQITSSTPVNGGTIQAGGQIQLVFDKNIDATTFATQMLIIEHNNTTVDYQYNISNNVLSITIPNQNLGTYYLYFSGYDLLNNQYLKATDGDSFEGTFSLQFDIVSETGDTGEENNVVPTNEVVILTDTVSDITVSYPTMLVTPTFTQTFSEDIAQQFDIQVSIENFDGSYSVNQYTVTDISTPAFYQNNQLTINFSETLTNSIITISTVGDIEFANGVKKSFEFVVLTQLQPYINLKQSLSQLGSYSKEIKEHELWYQALSQMIQYENNFGESIIGKSILTPQTKMFLQRYQYLELLTLLLNRKMILSGTAINTGVQSVSFGRVNANQIQFIESQKQELVSSYAAMKPVTQNKQINSDITLHSKALQQLKLWEEIFGLGSDF